MIFIPQMLAFAGLSDSKDMEINKCKLKIKLMRSVADQSIVTAPSVEKKAKQLNVVFKSNTKYVHV